MVGDECDSPLLGLLAFVEAGLLQADCYPVVLPMGEGAEHHSERLTKNKNKIQLKLIYNCN